MEMNNNPMWDMGLHYPMWDNFCLQQCRQQTVPTSDLSYVSAYFDVHIAIWPGPGLLGFFNNQINDYAHLTNLNTALNSKTDTSIHIFKIFQVLC